MLTSLRHELWCHKYFRISLPPYFDCDLRHEEEELFQIWRLIEERKRLKFQKIEFKKIEVCQQQLLKYNTYESVLCTKVATNKTYLSAKFSDSDVIIQEYFRISLPFNSERNLRQKEEKLLEI